MVLKELFILRTQVNEADSGWNYFNVLEEYDFKRLT
jgi:hypothetical protein